MKLWIAVALFAVHAFTHAGELADTWTVRSHGTIYGGYDYQGIFGDIGRDLTGLEITQTIVSSVDPADYTYSWEDPNYRFTSEMNSPFYISVTVDGRTLEMSATLNLGGGLALVNGLTNGTPYGYNYDQVATNAKGSTDDDQYVSAGISASSMTKGFVPKLDFHQSLTQDLTGEVTGWAYFSYSKTALSYPYPTFFEATLDTITVNPDAVDVPEPGSVALLGVGITGLIAMRRRK